MPEEGQPSKLALRVTGTPRDTVRMSDSEDRNHAHRVDGKRNQHALGRRRLGSTHVLLPLLHSRPIHRSIELLARSRSAWGTSTARANLALGVRPNLAQRQQLGEEFAPLGHWCRRVAQLAVGGPLRQVRVTEARADSIAGVRTETSSAPAARGCRAAKAQWCIASARMAPLSVDAAQERGG